MPVSFDTGTLIALAAAFAGGALLGALVTAIVYLGRVGRLRTEREALRVRLRSEDEMAEERSRTLEAALTNLQVAFDELANRSLSSHSESFLRLAQEKLGQFQTHADADLKARKQAIAEMIKPIASTLDATRTQLQQTESERQRAFGAIDQHLHAMRASNETLQLETNRLVSALQRPDVSGQWGEITLRRLVELAGMVEHCDFVEQPQIEGDSGKLRPDLIIKLPDRGQIIVDAKTPLNAYLAAAQASDDATRDEALRRHAQNLRNRVRELAAKNYWAQFADSPDFVLMFVPGDQFLAAALSADGALLEDALKLRIMPVTPTSLVALLKAIAYGWRHAALADNAEKIRDLAEELYKRLATFTDHVANLGSSLTRSVEAYNRAVGSLERSVLPGARKFAEMGVAEKKKLATTEPIDQTTRKITATEEPADAASPKTSDAG